MDLIDENYSTSYTGYLFYFLGAFFGSKNTNYHPNFIFTIFFLQKMLGYLRYIADAVFLGNSYNL